MEQKRDTSPASIEKLLENTSKIAEEFGSDIDNREEGSAYDSLEQWADANPELDKLYDELSMLADRLEEGGIDRQHIATWLMMKLEAHLTGI